MLSKNYNLVIRLFHYMAYVIFILKSNAFIEKCLTVSSHVFSQINLSIGTPRIYISACRKWSITGYFVFFFNLTAVEPNQNIFAYMLNIRNGDIKSFIFSRQIPLFYWGSSYNESQMRLVQGHHCPIKIFSCSRCLNSK